MLLQVEGAAVSRAGGLHPGDGGQSRDAPGETAEDAGEGEGAATEAGEGEGRTRRVSRGPALEASTSHTSIFIRLLFLGSMVLIGKLLLL